MRRYPSSSNAADVAGTESSLLVEDDRVEIAAPPVAREHVRTAHDDLSLASSVGVEVDLDPGQRDPDRAGPSLTVERVRDEHHRLGHAVPLEDDLAQALPHLRVQFGVERRRTADAQSERPQPRPFGMIDEPPVHRRDPEEHRRLVIARGTDHVAGVEPREHHGRRTGDHRAVHAHAQAVHVEQGQREHQAVGVGPSPRDPQGLHARQEVPMGQHRPLGTSGRARRVADQRRRRRVDHVEAGGSPSGRSISGPTTSTSGSAAWIQPAASSRSTRAAAGRASPITWANSASR